MYFYPFRGSKVLRIKQLEDMLLSAIGALGTLGATIYSGIQSRRLNEQAQADIRAQRQRNEDFYRTELARPTTTRGDYLDMLGRQRDLLNEQYGRARRVAAVTGETDAQIQGYRDAANKAIADTTSSMAASAAGRQDSLRSQMMTSDNGFAGQEAALLQGQAQQVANAGAQVSKAGSKLIGIDGIGDLSDELAALGLKKRDKK